MNTVAFNGKFLTAAPTGVHRVAGSLITWVDEILREDMSFQKLGRWELLCPPDARRQLPVEVIAAQSLGPLTWQFWEQFELPFRSRNKLLVNLCNLAPLAVRGGITMIHDAQVFISPASYSPAFARWYQYALPRIGSNAAQILTVSEYSRQQLAKYGIAPLSRITAIHNGVDHILSNAPDDQVVDSLRLERGKFVVALANTQPHKNIAVLLRAFARPELSALRLVLVGAATAKDFQSGDAPVPGNVVFAGRVSDEQMRGLLEAAACLAFPSTTEGFGLPPLEAMLVGCPAIVAPCGALPEVCGDSAAYVEPHDERAWAQAILAYVEDPAARADASARGRAHAAQFTWRNSAQRLLTVIEGVLSERSRSN